jgi:hypothetical protein
LFEPAADEGLEAVVWKYDATKRSAPVFVAEYGDEAAAGDSSVKEPSSIEPVHLVGGDLQVAHPASAGGPRAGR